MSMEFYFSVGVLAFLCIGVFVQIERFIEARVFGDTEGSYVAINRFCLMHEKVCHNSNEFYCFFNKSAFDSK